MDTADDDFDDEKFYENFKKQLTEVNEFANVILRSHILVEQDLDDALAIIFFHPDYVLDSRLSFDRKVKIVRAMSLRADNAPVFEVMFALNALRNSFAHRFEVKEREGRMQRLRQVTIAAFKEERREEHKNLNNQDMVVHACAMCSGYLLLFTEGYANLRKKINEIDAEINPDEERVSIRYKEED
jgi:hypothetical protein